MHELISAVYGGSCPNFGNRLWFQAIISEIMSEDNSIEYWDSSKSFDEINSNYDMVIAPMANIFSIGFKSLLEKLAQNFSKIKIPIYVIACGVQAKSYDDLDTVCKAIRKPATDLIRAIYNSGGEFALRGYFSKEFFDRLGFPSAVVTGCPSLYQIGRNINISIPSDDNSVQSCDFAPVLNGNLKEAIYYLEKYPNSVFLDQHSYYGLLYRKDSDAAYNVGMIKSLNKEIWIERIANAVK